MTSSSKPGAPYARFIPREELGDFAAWQPGSLNRPAPGAAPAVPETSAAEWQARVDAARQSGYQDGYRDGLVALEGFKQSFASQATRQIGALIEGFDTQFGELEAAVAAAVASTAVQLARQVVRHELQVDATLVARVAAEAVDTVMLSARQITVQVHPQDLPLVADGAADVLQARGARLVASAAVQRGGVLVESDVGSVDARIAVRWQQAAAALGSDEPWEDAP